jgi:ribosome maturation protein SDO1
MAQISNTIVCRLERGGEKFEILCDPKLSYDYKTGARKDWTNVLMVEEIFEDANKGERTTAAKLKKAFGALTDTNDVAKYIFAHGELQITTDQRRKLTEEKHAKIVNLISRNCVDPRTKAPHPIQRIESALQQVRIHVDPFKPAEEQVAAAIEALREILPISVEKAKIAVKIPAEFAPRAYGGLKEYGFSKEEWTNTGDLVCVVELPAGMKGEFFDKVNKLTSGQAQTKEL